MTSIHATARTTSHQQRIWSLAMLVSCCLFLCSVRLPAQTTPAERLTHAYELERAGRPASAIPELQQLLKSGLLDDASRGKAWDILGLAYQDEDDVTHARHAYEQSVRVLAKLPNSLSGYAMALDDFGQLYVNTGQFDTAMKLRTKALRLYTRVDDHAGMARTASHLAGTAFSDGNVAKGRKFLKQAAEESELANNLGEDDRAAIDSLNGWEAQLDGDVETSITSYARALALVKERHGEEHLSTGWAYLLLGRARATAGQWTDALEAMRKGLAILDRTVGQQNQHYLAAEIAYAQVLDAAGFHSEAATIRGEAQPLLKELSREPCSGCTVPAAAFQ